MDSTIGTPFTDEARRVLLCGSGELGKEVVIELQRYGVEVIAVDAYANAPAMQVAGPPGVAPGQAITAMGPDGKQYTTTVPVGAGPGQLFQLNLQADAAWWRSVEPPLAVPMAVQPQAGPQGMQMVRHDVISDA